MIFHYILLNHYSMICYQLQKSSLDAKNESLRNNDNFIFE